MKALKVVLSVVFFVTTFSSFAQDISFLEQFGGIWSGNLEMVGKRGQVKTIPMRMEINQKKDSLWTWKTTYDEKKVPVIKDYDVRMVNEAEGRYILDEHDGILINMNRMGSKLYCVFDVEGTILSCTYEVREGKLYYEIVSGPSKPALVSTLKDGNKVNSYSIGSLQRAVLEKQ